MALNLLKLRVDQIGSLVNPPALIAAYQRYEAGALDEADLARAQDEAVRHVVRAQQRIGFPVVSDGEMRRRNFQDNFGHSVSGFDVPPRISYQQALADVTTAPLARAEQNFAGHGPAIVMRRRTVAPLRLERNIPLEEYAFAAPLTDAPVKATILSADRIVQRFDHQRSTGVYRDREAFLADVVKISRDMISALVAAGCRYIQIDAPGYTAYVDEVSLERMRLRGEDPGDNLAMSMAADNAVIEGFDDVVFGIHVCRGNARTRDPKTGRVVAQFHREGTYDDIAEMLFGTLKHHRWLLEYDSERSGGFEPLRFLPKDRMAVLGLVTTKSNEIESTDLLRRRIDEAARHVDIDQLALSPQCGFGGFGHETITEDEQWTKLSQILKTADLTWGSAP